MPFDGSGNYTRIRNWQNDAAAGIKIKSDLHDSEDNGFASGLSNVICKDGQTAVTADIPFNGKKLTNVANPVGPQDAATKNYADSIRSFSTAISLTGATPQSRIGFTVADIGFGAREAGVPAGSASRWVWNDKPDLSGTDVAVLSEVGNLSLTGSPGGATNFVVNAIRDAASAWSAMLAGFCGWLQFDKSTGSWNMLGTAASVAAGAAAAQTTLMTVDKAGNVTATGNFLAAGTAFASSSNSVVLATTGAGTVILRPNGAGSASGQATLNNVGNLYIPGRIDTGYYEGGHFNATVANVAVNIFGNHRCKNGVAISGGTYGGNYFNMLWNGAMQLFVDNTLLGPINTTSDYRIKKDVADLPSTWEQVKALRPISYTQAEFQPPMSDETKVAAVRQAIEEYAKENDIPVEEVSEKDLPAKPAADPLFTADDIERWGFIAHEAQATLVPTAATGEKDMQDGVQGLQWAPILAATVKALQEAMARIEALEAAA